jgi:3-deoxy-D-manno-octulosonic-acid transferase
LEVVGDTRFDRVFELSQQIEPWEIKNQFVGKEEFAVAGSVWEADMQVLIPLMQQSHFKWIVAPHEMHEAEMKHWAEELNLPVAYSKGSTLEEIQDAKILFVNEFGRLSALYKSCKYAYIGGSFGAGLHNTLEAAVFGPPIFFGNKNYQKFQEAVDLIDKGIAFAIASANELLEKVQDLESNKDRRLQIQQQAIQFVQENIGASAKIMDYLINLEGWKKA